MINNVKKLVMCPFLERFLLVSPWKVTNLYFTDQTFLAPIHEMGSGVHEMGLWIHEMSFWPK
jgi:hypothetical protein